MNGWSAKDVTLNSADAQTVGASQTNTVISSEFPITAGGALNCVVKLKFSSVTVAAGITAKLQTAIGSDWVDSKTAAVSATGAFYIKLQTNLAGDQTFLPLLNKGRLVLTTGAGDTATVTSVEILQEL